MFVRGNALGWGFNEKLTSAQMNLADAQWPKAFDAVGGGVYTPTADVGIIDTTGVAAIGLASLKYVSIGGKVLINSTVVPSVSGNTNLGGTVQFTDSATVTWLIGSVALYNNGAGAVWHSGGVAEWEAGSSTQWDVGASVQIYTNAFTWRNLSKATWDSGATAHFNTGSSFQSLSTDWHWLSGSTSTIDSGANLNLNGTETIGSAASLEVNNGGAINIHTGGTVGNAGTLNNTGSIINTGVIQNTVGGHHRKRFVEMPNLDTTYTIADGDIFHVANLTATRFIKFSNTGADAGDEVWVTVHGMTGGNVLTVKDSPGTVLATLSNSGVAGTLASCHLVHNGTQWILLEQELV